MVEISQELIEMVNQPTRIGTLSTADKSGVPNVAYFGSPRLTNEKQMIVSLRNNRSLKNLQENPHAVFFFAVGAPVTPSTTGYRIYLKVKDIQKQGPVLDSCKKAIAERAGAQAAQSLAAAVIFDVTEIRPLVAMN